MKKIIFALFVLSGFALKTQAAAPNVANLPVVASTVTLVASGPGTLFSINISTGAGGDYAVCFDSASITGISTNTFGSTAVPELMSVVVSTVTNYPSAFPAASQPLVSFTNGLVCSQSAAQRTHIYYRQPN